MKEKRCCLKEERFVFPSLCSINAITDGCIVRKSRVHLAQAEKQTDVLRKNQEYIRGVQKNRRMNHKKIKNTSVECRKTDGCIVRKRKSVAVEKAGTVESKQSLFNVKYFADYKWYNL